MKLMGRAFAYAVLLVFALALWACDGDAPEGGADGTGSGPSSASPWDVM